MLFIVKCEHIHADMRYTFFSKCCIYNRFYPGILRSRNEFYDGCILDFSLILPNAIYVSGHQVVILNEELYVHLASVKSATYKRDAVTTLSQIICRLKA